MITTSCAPLIDRASMIKPGMLPIRGGAHNSLAGARTSHVSALRAPGCAAARGRVPCVQQSAFTHELSARRQHVAPCKQTASRRAPWVSTATTPTASGNPAPSSDDRPPRRAASGQHGGFQVDALAVAVFILLAAGGVIFYIKLETMPPVQAALHSIRKLLAIAAARQLLAIAVTMLVIKYWLNVGVMYVMRWIKPQVDWTKSKLFVVVQEVYWPLELLLAFSAICIACDALLPTLISVPKAVVSGLVSKAMTASYVLGFAAVVTTLKSRICNENAWEAEMEGDTTAQKQWDGYDKFGTFFIYVTTFLLVVQIVGIELTSVLAIGGVGGLAMGLAGREICENLLNGLIVMSTNPFDIGDEVHFSYNGTLVQGLVMDIGWYRTQFRSFAREVFFIPNVVFSRVIILNVTRRLREYRFDEPIRVRIADKSKVPALVADMRRLLRNDPRVIMRLHRRIFFETMTNDACVISTSFYIDAPSRDVYLAHKEDFLLAFLDCVERNGAKPADQRRQLEVDPKTIAVLSSGRMIDGARTASDNGKSYRSGGGGGIKGGLAAQAATELTLPPPPGRVQRTEQQPEPALAAPTAATPTPSPAVQGSSKYTQLQASNWASSAAAVAATSAALMQIYILWQLQI